MSSSLRILLISFVYLLLTACITEDEDQLKIIGNWKSSSSEVETYISFSTSEAISYTKHALNDCFTTEQQILRSLTNTSFSVDSTQNPGNELNLEWSISAGTLTISNLSTQEKFTYSRSNTVLSSLDICSEHSGNDNSNESQEQPTPDTLEVIGSWQDEDGYNLIFTESNVISAYTLDVFNCHTRRDVEITTLTSSSFTIEDNVINYEITDGKLFINEEPDHYTPSDLTEADLVSCADPEATGIINIEITFNELPNSLEINHALSADFWAAFELDIEFDIDANRELSNGDVNIYAEAHFNDSRTDIETISTNDLEPSIYYTHNMEATGNGTSWSSSYLIEPNFSIRNNTIILSIDKSQHKALADITSLTSTKVNVQFYDSQGDSQFDRYPNSNTYTLESENTADLVDELNDVNGSYSSDTIVDISTISITVTN